MFGEKFATRLNSFASKPENFWKNYNSTLTVDPEHLIERAGTVKGLTDIRFKFPDHVNRKS